MDIKELLNDWLKPGDSFSAVFATVDIIESSELEGDSFQISDTVGALRALINELIANKPIGIMDWDLDGGILLGDAAKGCDELVIVCDKLVSLLPFFNRSRNTQIFLKHDMIHLRVSCHSAWVVNSGDEEILHDKSISALAKNERDIGVQDHVVITHEVNRGIKTKIIDRFSITKSPHPILGACYILDEHQITGTVEINNRDTDILRIWISSKLSSGKYNQVDIFGYTNESLPEYIVPFNNAKVRILTRNWLDEHQDEIDFNRIASRRSDKKTGTWPAWKPWAKSSIIRSMADVLLNPDSIQPFKSQIEMRFYSSPPWFKGALLRNSETKNRAGFIGHYPFTPSYSLGGSPYEKDQWSGLWLSEDNGPKSVMLDSIESRFNELWEFGDSYEDVYGQESDHPTNIYSIFKDVWDLNGKPYLIVYPASESRRKPFPKVVTEDLMACLIIEQRLSYLDAVIDFEPLDIDQGFSDKIKSWDGHIVLVCYRSWLPIVQEHLESIKFPFIFQKKTNTELPAQTHSIRHLPHENQDYSSPMDLNNPRPEDYCVVGRTTSPFNDSKLFIIAGIHGLGTWGGCEFLTDHKHLRHISKGLNDANFACLVQCRFDLPHRMDNVWPVTQPDIF